MPPKAIGVSPCAQMPSVGFAIAPPVQVGIDAELVAELVSLRLVETASSEIPVKYAKPDGIEAPGELVLLNCIQDRAAPALASLALLDS